MFRKNCANQTSRASDETKKGWAGWRCIETSWLNPRRHASGPLRWLRPKQSGSQKKLGSRWMVAPFRKVRTSGFPHQETEGTRRTRVSTVHVGQCTEYWLLFARTPKKKEKTQGRLLQRNTETHSFWMLSKTTDLLNELTQWRLELGKNICFSLRDKRMENRDHSS